MCTSKAKNTARQNKYKTKCRFNSVQPDSGSGNSGTFMGCVGYPLLVDVFRNDAKFKVEFCFCQSVSLLIKL